LPLYFALSPRFSTRTFRYVFVNFAKDEGLQNKFISPINFFQFIDEGHD